MYVKSSLAAPLSSSGEPQCFDPTCWKPLPMQAINMSKLACGLPSHVSMYADGSYAFPETHETDSEASTADTTPQIPEEGFYVDTSIINVPDLAWHGIYPPMNSELPFPTFDKITAQLPEPQPQLPRKRAGWVGPEHIPDATQAELPTLGSAKHQLGQCKPCAFAWKPEGCESGENCSFCHLCPPGEKQRRKKVLRQIQRTVGIYR